LLLLFLDDRRCDRADSEQGADQRRAVALYLTMTVPNKKSMTAD